MYHCDNTDFLVCENVDKTEERIKEQKKRKKKVKNVGSERE